MRVLASLAAALTAVATSLPAVAQPGARPTWDTVEDLIAAEVERGFAGSVLLVRGGEVVLHKGYGLAERERGTPNTAETIFAIGSTPIDFTLVAVLQLAGEGRLALDDTIGRYFDGFDEPKRGITIEQLMTGRSGFPDFLDRPSDVDPDHGPLSRDEFVQRLREDDLLFEPGTSREHSHAAWNLLAAIVEVVSGRSYEDYLDEHILGPAGMTRTGPYGRFFPGETVATGYGSRSWGEKNTPPYWGDTSWLVRGSGGMVGTTGDLYRFHEAVAAGKLVPESYAEHFPDSGLAANGDMYGFECMFNIGGDDRFYLCTNVSNPPSGYNLEPFARALYAMCTNAPVSRYSIGIGMSRDGGRVTVTDVVPGAPAASAGLRPGDVLLEANGVAFESDRPLEALRDAIENGTKTEIKLLREGQELTVTLTPRAREG